MSRNSKALIDFITYCSNHPDQRFWQALRNWSKYSFILGTNCPPYELSAANEFGDNVNIDDTFYLEGLDGTRKEK